MAKNNDYRKQPPGLGDLCALVGNLFGLKKDDPKYVENHKKAVTLIESLNKENGDGFCSLSLARKINAEYYVRQKVKLYKGE